MSKESSLVVFSLRLIGLITLLIGSYLTYLSLTVEGGIMNPKLFTPLGVVTSIIGILILTARVR
jgi:hypothetical protein